MNLYQAFFWFLPWIFGGLTMAVSWRLVFRWMSP